MSELAACCLDLTLLVLIRVSELKQYIPKAGHIVMAAAIFWKIGSNIEWLLIRCQKNRQRPTSCSSGKLASALINIIEVRTLLSVNLDVDEVLIHYLGNFVIFKGLMCHDMVPVTCAITNTQEDRLICAFCFL